MQSRASEMSSLKTVVDRIRYWASTHPEREAFVFRRHDGSRFPLSRAAYLRLATRFAARLQSLGLQHGDVVCNFLQNSPERAVTDLGIMLSGAVPMNGAPLLADGADVKGCLQKGRAKALIVDPEQNDGAWEVCQKVLDPCQAGPCQSAELPDLKQVLFSRRSKQGDLLLFDELEASTKQFLEVNINLEDAAYIFTTSGSTGFSKLVLQTHEQLMHWGLAMISFFKGREPKIVFVDSSLGWSGGFPHSHVTFGSTRVLLDARSGRPSDYVAFLWPAVVEEKVDTLQVFSTTIAESLRRRDLWEGRHEVEVLRTGGQPVGRSCIKALVSSGGFARCFAFMYGSTEAGFVAGTFYTHENQYEDFLLDKPFSGLEVKIVDESLKPLPNGTKGELILRSKQCFKGYFRDEEATKKAFTDDGWFRTSDVAYFDDRGRLFVMGRHSDAIMRGAFIVVPQWLEVRVRGCPGVKDVMVVAVPDDVLCHEVCACVIREEGSVVTEEDLDAHCRSLFLSGAGEEKTPRPKYYLFFEQFPVNANDKTDRKLLAKIAAKRLGL